MPKETFVNLSEDKKRKIMDAAVHEFSIRRFSEASINQIVKLAGISRGSFYQYFDGKEDLFAHMIEGINAEIATLERKSLSHYEDCDALTRFSNKVSAVIQLNRLNPAYVQITAMQSKDDHPFVKQYFQLQETQKQQIVALFVRDQQRGLVRDDVDLEVVIEMVFTLSKALFESVGMNSDAYCDKLESYLKIIRQGIGGVNHG